MTRDELAKILETFASAVIYTSMSDISADKQYELISKSIDKIADTVMLFVDRSIPRPSSN